LRTNELPKHVDRGVTAYFPPIAGGVRGWAAPGSGGLLLSAAFSGVPPSVPVIAALGPGTAFASSFSCLPPLTQSTVPVSL
jgi:hypothetical protein